VELEDLVVQVEVPLKEGLEPTEEEGVEVVEEEEEAFGEVIEVEEEDIPDLVLGMTTLVVVVAVLVVVRVIKEVSLEVVATVLQEDTNPEIIPIELSPQRRSTFPTSHFQ